MASPAAMHVTSPLLFTVATDVLLLLHVPPVVPSLENVTTEPGQFGNKLPPVTVPAVAFEETITAKVALCCPPQPFTV